MSAQSWDIAGMTFTLHESDSVFATLIVRQCQVWLNGHVANTVYQVISVRDNSEWSKP